jgi:hypothetical protein
MKYLALSVTGATVVRENWHGEPTPLKDGEMWAGTYVGSIPELSGRRALLRRGMNRWNRAILLAQFDEKDKNEPVMYRGANLCSGWHEFLPQDWKKGYV